jgi:PST family polysaccharide transporter
MNHPMGTAERQPEETTAERAETLADGILILLVLTVAQRGIGFLRAILFCRWLDAEQLGQWDMAFSFLMIAAPLSVMAISSSFRRYVEYYRQRGALGPFLRRTSLAYCVLGCASVALVAAASSPISRLVFGTGARSGLVVLMALSLAAVIAHHYFLDLCSALRNARLLAALQMANSIVFAVAGVVLLWLWRCDASSVVIAYGLACAVSAGIAMLARGPAAEDAPGLPAAPARISVWPRILPFVAWISLANFMAGMFDVADRYMIIHYSGTAPEGALAQIGVYHTCRVVPLLLVSVVAMVGSIVTPHLSHDWEAGRRSQVAARLQLLLKLFAFGLTAASVLVLFAAPLLFSVAFKGKFDGAMAVLPWTLVYCTWFALFGLLQNYTWCCEKAHLATITLFCGLVVNIGLNLVLLPRFGLLGAVLATAAANITALSALAAVCRKWGLRLDRSCWVSVALPVAVCLGPALASLVLVAVSIEAAAGKFLLNESEKRSIFEGAGGYFGQVRRFFTARGKQVRATGQ